MKGGKQDKETLWKRARVVIITYDYMQIGVLSSQLSRPIAAQLRKDSGSPDLELSPCFIKKEESVLY